MEDIAPVRSTPMDSVDLAKLAQQAIRPIAGSMSALDGRQNAMELQGNNILLGLKVVMTTLSAQFCPCFEALAFLRKEIRFKLLDPFNI